ncbi:MAG: hypothetical protein SFU20_01275 [Chitinophagaceae bacterium]|nr:hypothetical protein [Chitinophagaceae bacterium]
MGKGKDLALFSGLLEYQLFLMKKTILLNLVFVLISFLLILVMA